MSLKAYCGGQGCTDGLIDGRESDVDCGGGASGTFSCYGSCCQEHCGACAAGKHCHRGDDCISTVCHHNVCVADKCDDGQQNFGEAGVDCGGPCPGCPDGTTCSQNGDCASGMCLETPFGSTCVESSCSDSIQDDGEAGIDCGGVVPQMCR